jgi:hypothetical protein
MKSIRNSIKHITKTVTVIAALFTMSYVLAGNASAVVIGPLGNPTVVQAPIGTGLNPVGVQPGIVNSPVASSSFVGAPGFSPFFNAPVVSPFFHPFFNPFIFHPFFNPFFNVDVDPFFGAGLGVGAVD